MLRTIFVVVLVAVGTGFALRRPFYAALFYLWVAYFRPESWLWFNFVGSLSLIVGVYLLAACVLSRPTFRFDWRCGFLFLFLAQSLLSVFASTHFDNAWFWWQDFAKTIVITYLLVVLTSDRFRFRAVLLTIALSLGFEAAKQGWAGLILQPGGINMNEIPLLGDNNGVAVGLLMLVPVFIALSRTTNRRWERYLYYFLATGVAYRGLSTYSRGGFLSCSVLVAFYIARSSHKLRTIAGIILVAALVLPVLPTAFWDRMGTMTTSEEKMDDSAAGRVHFWRVAVVMANDRPFTGVGHYSYNLAFDQYDFLNGKYGRNRSVHSVWFGVLAELGWIGLTLFILTIALAIIACRQVAKLSRKRPDLKDLGEYAIAVETALAVFSVGGSFVPSQYIEMFWHFIGLSIALRFIAIGLSQVAELSPERLASPKLVTGMAVAVAPAAWRAQ